MNLRTIYDKISAAAVQADPNVGDIYYGDIYYLNHIQTVKYPAVVVTSGTHQADVDDYFFGFRFNIFYVERLLDNHSNKIDIHANGINFLNSLLKHLDDEFIISNYDIQCFNERFNDMCAGAFTNVLIKFPIDQCYEIIDANPPTPPTVKNLLDENYCDEPNGSMVSPQQYYFATYPITEKITEGTRVRFYIKMKTNYEQKTMISIYNSGSAAGSVLIRNIPIINGIAEAELDWKESGGNNILWVYALPSSSSLPVPTAEHAELTKI